MNVNIQVLSEPQKRLLVAFSHGVALSGWEFGAATMSWAKKKQIITLCSAAGKDRRYRITDAGREIAQAVARCAPVRLANEEGTT